LGFGILGLIIGLPSTFFITQVYQDELIKDRGLALRDLAQAAAAVVGADLQERQREITLLAQSPLYREAPLDSPAIHDSLTRVQRAYTRYSWIGLADAQGQVRNATGDLLLGADVSRRPWFQQGLTGPAIGDLHEALLLSKLLPAPPDGQTIRFIDFASPVHDPQGQVRGVLAAHAHWDWAGEVMRLLAPLQATQTGLELFIVNRQGRILYPEAAGTPAQIPTALAAETPFLSLDWGDAGPYLSALAPVAEVLPDRPLGWSIATRQPRARVLAEVTGLRTAMMLLAGLAVVFFAALAWWSAARFSRPLERLVGLAQRIEQEDDVALPPAATASTAEFQALDEALHAMATTLIQRRVELQRINRGLEAEIARRTADLRRSEARARAFMQTAFDGVVVIDDQSRI
ncbi:MAG TPA: cache domain-containing protein, partial [Chromatiaceae bacterium]|nr:cache domain-containing protein [Chromatiaceae bacterium]